MCSSLTSRCTSMRRVFPVGRTPGHEQWNEIGDGGRSSSRSGSPRSRDGVPFASGELNAMADMGDRRVPSTRWQGPLGCGDHRGSIRPLRASAGRGVRPSGHRLHRPHRRSALRSRRHRPVPRRGIEQPCTTGARMRIRLHPSTVMGQRLVERLRVAGVELSVERVRAGALGSRIGGCHR